MAGKVLMGGPEPGQFAHEEKRKEKRKKKETDYSTARIRMAAITSELSVLQGRQGRFD